jgi:hypothetical protein
MFNAGSHTPEFYSGNMIEQKNSRVKVLKALVSRENQPRMMSTFRYWHAAENILQMARLQHQKQELGETHRLTQAQPHALYGVDGTFVPQGMRHSFICRRWEHPDPDCEERWGNPVQSKHRQMIGSLQDREALKTMLKVTPSEDYKEFRWNQAHQQLVAFLWTDERKEVLWLIRLECKSASFRVRTAFGQSEPCWVPQTPEMLRTIELDTSVRFSSLCKIVRNVFLNWAARNPEVQFVFPICVDVLRKLLDTQECAVDDLHAARDSSGQHVRNILDFDLNLARTVVPTEPHEDVSLSVGCRNLLKLILQIVDNSLQISSESVDAGHYAPISQLAEHINSESWLLTAEYFPNNPVRKTPTGDLLQARRYLADERRDGSRKTLREECADCVCNKHLYTGKNSNPGLLTVHCMYCCVNVGFSFLARPESVRTCFNLFWHRQMLREPRDELDNDAILCENEMEEPVDDAQAMSSVPDDLQASTADSEQEYVSSAESTSSVL